MVGVQLKKNRSFENVHRTMCFASLKNMDDCQPMSHFEVTPNFCSNLDLDSCANASSNMCMVDAGVCRLRDTGGMDLVKPFVRSDKDLVVDAIQKDQKLVQELEEEKVLIEKEIASVATEINKTQQAEKAKELINELEIIKAEKEEIEMIVEEVKEEIKSAEEMKELID
jgi:hypothetical protein